MHGYQWTGVDTFAGKNVLSVALEGEPATDAAQYLPLWSNILQQAGGYSADEATAVAGTVLPDILRYDHTRPAGYPNGRILSDDVFSARMAFLTNGKAGATGLKPHGDMQADFPFLGVPNP
jgi:hypothetical protein